MNEFKDLNDIWGIFPDKIAQATKTQVKQLRDMFNKQKEQVLKQASEEQKAAIELIEFSKESIEDASKSIAQVMNSIKDEADKVAEDFEGLMKNIGSIEYKKKFQTLYDAAWADELVNSDVIAGYVPKLPKIKIQAFPENPEELLGFLHQTTILDGDPWDEYQPVDSAVMWEEQKFSGKPEYQYNKVHTSEAGHQTIIDDTPGNERLQWTHGQTGTYEEWNASGDRNCKITGTSRDTVDGHRLIKTAADYKSSTMGNEQSYVLGNRVDAVDGSEKRDITGARVVYIADSDTITVVKDQSEEIQGNRKLLIKGNWDIEVQGNVNLIVNGNVTSQVKGTSHTTVEGDATVIANSNLTQKVAGNWDVQVGGSASLKSSGNFFIDGSRIDLG